MSKLKIVSIIPARGGSKGIAGKNLKKINGKSLVEHSIDHSLNCKIINRTIVSSDSAEILDVARACGAEAPFVRPSELAEDHVLDYPVFLHAIKYLIDQEKYIPDIVVHLRPTTPYRKPVWIEEAIHNLVTHPFADSCRSVSAPSMHPYRMFTINDSNILVPIMKHEHPEPFLLRRQDHPPMYHYNCVIDVSWVSTILEKGSMTGSNMVPYIMNPDDVIDIDTKQDLLVAEFLLRIKL